MRAILAFFAGAASGVSQTEHDRLPTARLAGISGGVQVRIGFSANNILQFSVQSDRYPGSEHSDKQTIANELWDLSNRTNGGCLVYFTSHGSPDGIAVSAGRRSRTLTPSRLAGILRRTGVRYKVVIISACYSGIFIPRLANSDTLVITAADRDHPSFGCEDKAKWTYFGDAFFNSALRQSGTLREAFLRAHSLVSSWERRSGFEPSNPQIAGGENVEPLLIARH